MTDLGRTVSALLRMGLLPLAFASTLAVGRVQAQQLTIPLQLIDSPGGWKLGITVGINGGTPQPYVFDTGSSIFNAAFNPATWNGITQAIVNSGIEFKYSYASTVQFTGRLIPLSTINFYAPGATAGSPVVASLVANPGFQIGAVETSTENGGQTFPQYFQSPNPPPHLGAFYGVFGAGNFRSATGGGGVLGQAILPGMTQGYVVSANGPYNPPTRPNGPQGTQIVTIAGSQQPVSAACESCVTVGLTPQVIGQFVPVGPLSSGVRRGVVPVVPGASFFNPYGGAVGNNGALEFGTTFNVVVTPKIGAVATATDVTLLDTGTVGFRFGATSLEHVSFNDGTTVRIAGGDGGIPGLQASTTTLGGGPPYAASFVPGLGGNTIGLPLFLQNSVMLDLSDGVIGYTPFYVTTASLATTASGPLIVTGANVPLGLAGVVSGPGGIVLQAGGAVQLSATNTYTGPTAIAPSAALLIAGPGSIAQSSGVANDGTFDISRAWAPVAIQSLSGSGQVNLGSQNLTITNASGTFSGTMVDGGSYPASGGSLTLAGGALTFAGTGSYTGGTIVSGGSFNLTGSLIGDLLVLPAGSFTVASGGSYANPGGVVLNLGATTVNGTMTASVFNAGTLGGTGSIVGNVLNLGTVAPGNSIGTLTVTGNYLQGAGATYLAEFNGSGQSDLVNVGGRAALLGGAVSVYAQPGTTYAPRSTWRILTAAGGLTGTFASVNELYPFLQSSLSYDANNVYLTLEIGGFAAAAATATQAAVGNVLDANVNTATGDFANVLSAMATGILSNTQAQATLQALSGNNYAGFSTSMVQGAHLFMNNFANQTGGGGSTMSNRVALAEACNVACDATTPPKWGAWGGALGGLGTIGANQSVGAVTYNAGGFAAGLDRSITDNFRMGVTAGYTTGTQWVSGFDGMGRSNTFQVGLYGGFAQDKVYADALIGYAYTWNQMWRNIPIPGLQPRTANGQTGANQWYGQIETGYRFDLGTNANAFVTPFARLQAYTANQNAFTETGAQSLNLSVAQQQTNSLRSVIGAQIGGSMDLGWREKLLMQLRLGWSHEYADVARPVSATLAGAPAMPFTTFGISPQRDGVVVGLAANTAIAEATSIYLRYEGDISGQDSAHAITAGLRMSW